MSADRLAAECVFCGVAQHSVESVVVYEDDEVIAVLDIAPIRPGHTQIVPKRHVETFGLAARIIHLGQQIARRLKERYGVERVAFLFTGGDIPHAHAHVVPLHEITDITSARYIVSGGDIGWSATHLAVDLAELRRVQAELAFAASD